MNHDFIFWAQALDNLSTDHMSVNDEELTPDDIKQREDVVSTVSHVVKTGTCEFESGGVKLTVNKTHFVVELLSVESDQAGRRAPIVCYGSYDLLDIDSLANLIASRLGDFTENIGRHTDSGYVKLLNKAFVTLSKKSAKKRCIRIAGVVIAAVILLTMIYLIFSHLPGQS